MTMWVAGASVVSAGIGYMSSQNSANAMKKAGADPFGRANRRLYQGQLNALMQNPDSILSSPMFTSSLDLGLSGVERHMAAQGFLGSGNEAAALMKYGQTFGLDWLKNQESFLAMLAGAGNFGSPQTQAAGAQMGYQGTQDALGQLGGAMSLFGSGGGSFDGAWRNYGYGGGPGLNPSNYAITPAAPNIGPQTFTPLGG